MTNAAMVRMKKFPEFNILVLPVDSFSFSKSFYVLNRLLRLMRIRNRYSVGVATLSGHFWGYKRNPWAG